MSLGRDQVQNHGIGCVAGRLATRRSQWWKADASLYLMQRYEGDGHINVRTGQDLTIRELAEMVRAVVHPDAELVFDTTKPDGSPRKLLDVGRLHDLGWRHQIDLRRGIETTYEWFLAHHETARP